MRPDCLSQCRSPILCKQRGICFSKHRVYPSMFDQLAVMSEKAPPKVQKAIGVVRAYLHREIRAMEGKRSDRGGFSTKP